MPSSESTMFLTTSRWQPRLAWLMVVLGASVDTARSRMRRRSPTAGSRLGGFRNVAGNPLRSRKIGAVFELVTLLLMRPGTLRESWSSLPTRSKRL